MKDGLPEYWNGHHTLPYVKCLKSEIVFVNTLPYGQWMKQQSNPILKRARPGTDHRIGPEAWVRAGLSLLSREGIDAVRVEPLAVRLGVTKGSFYWHFKDRPALHLAMLQAWGGTATGDIIRLVEAETGSPQQRLFRLVEVSTSNSRAARLETAIRAWAQHDAGVARIVAGIDAERLAYVVGLLRGSGIDAGTAETRAKILYLVLIGSFFAAPSADIQAGPDVWREITKLIT